MSAPAAGSPLSVITSRDASVGVSERGAALNALFENSEAAGPSASSERNSVEDVLAQYQGALAKIPGLWSAGSDLKVGRSPAETSIRLEFETMGLAHAAILNHLLPLDMKLGGYPLELSARTPVRVGEAREFDMDAFRFNWSGLSRVATTREGSGLAIRGTVSRVWIEASLLHPDGSNREVFYVGITPDRVGIPDRNMDKRLMLRPMTRREIVGFIRSYEQEVKQLPERHNQTVKGYLIAFKAAAARQGIDLSRDDAALPPATLPDRISGETDQLKKTAALILRDAAEVERVTAFYVRKSEHATRTPLTLLLARLEATHVFLRRSSAKIRGISRSISSPDSELAKPAKELREAARQASLAGDALELAVKSLLSALRARSDRAAGALDIRNSELKASRAELLKETAVLWRKATGRTR